ncbi:hypothetical protein PSHT_05361 [Puccinia striiformis]|uniref:SCP domain-containing protein n=1 Tax=Puccinia striiformis TaxID=27350 RepID=A0A2S4WAS5_9BASI|nr:hypothetical protein PSHT_05361 [Puccinia striiformis]
MSNLHTALVTPSKAMSSKSSSFQSNTHCGSRSLSSSCFISHLHLQQRPFRTVNPNSGHVLTSTFLNPLQLQQLTTRYTSLCVQGPNCKTTNAALSVAGGSAQGNTKDIHHRAKISTRTKSSRSLRVRDCTLEGPKKDSPTPGKFGETKGPGKVKEKHKKPASAPKEEKNRSNRKLNSPKLRLKLPPTKTTRQTQSLWARWKTILNLRILSTNTSPMHQARKIFPLLRLPLRSTTPTPTTPTPSTPNPTSPEKPVPDTGDDSSKWLTAHNDIRKRYNAPPLVWDPKLAATAQGWANRCYFEHSKSGYGENIAAGYPTIESVVQDWAFGTDECPSWDPANPDYSHFTRKGGLGQLQLRLDARVKNCATLPGVPFKLINANFWVCNYGGPPDAPTDFKSNMHASAHQCLKG